MEVVIADSVEQVGAVAAAKVAAVCRAATRRRGAPPVLGVATGSSPLGLYEHLAAMVSAGDLDLTDASAFALDEYVGLPREHPQSYAQVIARTVTEPLGLAPDRVHVPDGTAADPEAASREYEERIRNAGGIDVQILGIGANGHIGFNEPGSSFSSRTRIKYLTERTREDNRRFFDSLDEVPTHCLTQGLGTIMDARELVLVAQGTGKAAAVAAMVEGPVSARCPASLIQFHRFATIVIDADAASGLQDAEYHRSVFDHKPDWQRWDR